MYLTFVESDDFLWLICMILIGLYLWVFEVGKPGGDIGYIR